MSFCINPHDVIISTRNNKKYSHPSEKTLTYLAKKGINVYCTEFTCLCEEITDNDLSCCGDIEVVDQDPLICAAMADSVRVRLQDFITTYRTSKARIDLNYYKQLTDSAQIEYQKALEKYSTYSDSHQNTILQAYLSERDELENKVGMKLNAYTTLATQYEAAKAKVQERTPAFTVLSGASVPIKATGPKRMIFVAAMLFLAFWGTCLYIYRKEIIEQLVNPAKKNS